MNSSREQGKSIDNDRDDSSHLLFQSTLGLGNVNRRDFSNSMRIFAPNNLDVPTIGRPRLTTRHASEHDIEGEGNPIEIHLDSDLDVDFDFNELMRDAVSDEVEPESLIIGTQDGDESQTQAQTHTRVEKRKPPPPPDDRSFVPHMSSMFSWHAPPVNEHLSGVNAARPTTPAHSASATTTTAATLSPTSLVCSQITSLARAGRKAQLLAAARTAKARELASKHSNSNTVEFARVFESLDDEVRAFVNGEGSDLAAVRALEFQLQHLQNREHQERESATQRAQRMENERLQRELMMSRAETEHLRRQAFQLEAKESIVIGENGRSTDDNEFRMSELDDGNDLDLSLGLGLSSSIPPANINMNRSRVYGDSEVENENAGLNMSVNIARSVPGHVERDGEGVSLPLSHVRDASLNDTAMIVAALEDEIGPGEGEGDGDTLNLNDSVSFAQLANAMSVSLSLSMNGSDAGQGEGGGEGAGENVNNGAGALLSHVARIVEIEEAKSTKSDSLRMSRKSIHRRPLIETALRNRLKFAMEDWERRDEEHRAMISEAAACRRKADIAIAACDLANRNRDTSERKAAQEKEILELELTQQINGLRAEIAELQATSNVRVEMLTAELSQTKSDLESKNADNAVLNTRVAALSTENEKNAGIQTHIFKLEGELEKAESESALLKTQLAVVRAAKKDLEETVKDIRERDVARQQQYQQETEAAAKLREECARLRREVAMLEAGEEEVQDELQLLLQAQPIAVCVEAAVQTDIDSKYESKSDSESESDTLHHLENSSTLAERDATIKSLREEMTRLEEQKRDDESKWAEEKAKLLSDAENVIAEMTKRLTDMASSGAASDEDVHVHQVSIPVCVEAASQTEIDSECESESEPRDGEATIKSLREEMVRLEEQKRDDESKWAEEKAKLLSDAENVIMEMTKRLTDMAESHSRTDEESNVVHMHSAQIAELIQQKDVLETENVGLSAEIASIKETMSEKLINATDEANELRVSKAGVEARVEILENRLAQVQESESRLESELQAQAQMQMQMKKRAGIGIAIATQTPDLEREREREVETIVVDHEHEDPPQSTMAMEMETETETQLISEQLRNEALRERVSGLESSVQALRSEMEAVQGENDELKSRLELELSKSVSRSKSHVEPNLVLQHQYEYHYLDEYEDVDDDDGQLGKAGDDHREEEIESLKSDLQQCESEISRLMSASEDSRATIELLTDQKRDDESKWAEEKTKLLSDAENAMAEMNERMSAISNEKDDNIASLRNELDDKSTTIKKLRHSISDLEDKLDTANSSVDSLNDDLSAANAKLLAQDQELERSESRGREMIKRESEVKSIIRKLEFERDGLQQRVELLQEENQRVNSEIDDALKSIHKYAELELQSDRQISVLSDEKGRLEHEVSRLSSVLSDLRTDMARLEGLRREDALQMAQVTEERDALTENNRVLSGKLENEKNATDSMEAIIIDLRKQLSIRNEQVSSSEIEISKLKDINSALRDHADTNLTSRKELEATVHDLQLRITSVVDDLKLKESELKSVRQLMVAVQSNAESELESVAEERDEYMNEALQLKQRLLEKGAETTPAVQATHATQTVEMENERLSIPPPPDHSPPRSDPPLMSMPMPTPMPPRTIQLVDEATMTDANDVLEREIERLQKMKSQFELDENEYRNQIDRLQSEGSQNESRIRQMELSHDQLSAKLQLIRQQLVSKTAENSKLRMDLERVRHESDLLQDSLRALKNRMIRVQEAAEEDLESVVLERDRAKEDTVRLRQSMMETSMRVENAENNAAAMMSKRREEERERDNGSEAINEKLVELKAESLALSIVASRRAELDTELDNMKNALEAAEKEIVSRQGEIDEYNREIDFFKAKCEHFEQSEQRVKADYAALENEVHFWRERAGGLEALVAEMDNTMVDLKNTLNNDRTAALTSRQEADDLRHTMAIVQGQHAMLIDELATVEDEKKKAISAAEEKQSMTLPVQIQHHNTDDQLLEGGQKAMDGFEKVLQTLRRQIRVTQEALDIADSDAKEAREQQKACEVAGKKMQEQITELIKERDAAMQELDTRKNVYRADMGNVADALAACERDLDLLSIRTAELETDNERLTFEDAERKQRESVMSQSLESTKAALTQSEIENNQLLRHSSDLESSLLVCQESEERLKVLVDALRDQLEHAVAERDSVSASMVEVEVEVDSARPHSTPPSSLEQCDAECQTEDTDTKSGHGYSESDLTKVRVAAWKHARLAAEAEFKRKQDRDRDQTSVSVESKATSTAPPPSTVSSQMQTDSEPVTHCQSDGTQTGMPENHSKGSQTISIETDVITISEHVQTEIDSHSALSIEPLLNRVAALEYSMLEAEASFEIEKRSMIKHQNELIKDIEYSRSELSDAQTAHAELTDVFHSMKHDQDALLQDRERIQLLLDSSEESNATLSKEVDSLRRENIEHTDQLSSSLESLEQRNEELVAAQQNLHSELDELNLDREQMAGEFHDLSIEKSGLEDRIDRMSTEIKEKDDMIQTIESELQRAEVGLGDKDFMLEHAEGKIASLEAEIESLTAKLTKNRTASLYETTRKEDANALLDAVKAAEKSIESATSAKQLLASHTAELQTAEENEEDQLEVHELEDSEWRKVLESWREERDYYISQAEDYDYQICELNAKIEDLDSTISSLQSKNEAAAAGVQREQTIEIEELKANVVGKEKEISDLKEKEQTAAAQIEALTSKVSEKEKESSGLQAEAKRMAELRKTSDSEIGVLKAKVSDLQSEMNQLEEERNVRDSEIESLKAKLSGLEQSSSSLVIEKEKEISKLQAELDQLKEQQKQSVDSVDMKTALEAREYEIEALKVVVGEKEKEISKLQAELDQLKEQQKQSVDSVDMKTALEAREYEIEALKIVVGEKEKEISKLQAELDQLKEQQKQSVDSVDMKTALEAREYEIEALKVVVGEKEKEISELAAELRQVKDRDSEIEYLEAKVSMLSSELASTQSTLHDTEVKYQTVLGRKSERETVEDDEHEQDDRPAQQKSADAIVQTEAVRSPQTEADSRNDQLIQAVWVDTCRAVIRRELSEARSRISSLKCELAGVSGSLSRMTAERDSYWSDARVLQNEAEQLAQLRHVSEDVDIVTDRQDQDDLLDELNGLHAEVNEANDQVQLWKGQLEHEVEEKAAIEERLAAEIQELKSHVKSLVDELSMKSEKLKASEASGAEKDRKLAGMEAAIESMEADHRRFRESTKDLESKAILRKEKEISELRSEVNHRVAELQARDVEIEGLKSDLAAKKKEISDLQSEVKRSAEQSDSEIESLKAKLSDLEQSGSALVSEKEKEISDLQSEVNQLKIEHSTEDEEVKNTLEARDVEIEGLKSKMDEKVEVTQSEMGELKAKLELRDSEIESLKAKLSDLEQSRSALVEEKEKEISDLQSEVKRLEELKARNLEIESLKAKVEEKEKEISDLQSEVNQLKIEHSAEDEEVKNTLEARDVEIEGLKSDLAAKKNEVSDLHSQVKRSGEQSDSEIESLKAKLSDLEQSRSALVEKKEKEISDLQSEVRQLIERQLKGEDARVSEIVALKAKVGDLEKSSAIKDKELADLATSTTHEKKKSERVIATLKTELRSQRAVNQTLMDRVRAAEEERIEAEDACALRLKAERESQEREVETDLDRYKSEFEEYRAIVDATSDRDRALRIAIEMQRYELAKRAVIGE